MANRNGPQRPGWFLREHMANQGVEIQELADKLRRPYQTVWRYVNATRQPRREMEALIERALKLGENALRKHPDVSDEKAFLAGLSDEGQIEVKNFAAWRRQKEQEGTGE